MGNRSRFSRLSLTVHDCPLYVITRASLLLTSAFKKSFAAAGLSVVRPAYILVLWCLWEKEGLSLTELGRCAGLEPSTMTGLLDRMERDGLVCRKPAANDRRALEIYLTDIGHEVRDTSERLVDETLEIVFDGVGDQEIDLALDVLQRAMENVRGGGV